MLAIKFAMEAYLDLKRLRAHDRSTIIDAMERYLTGPSLLLGRRIKLLDLADGTDIYRLRVGNYRVFFDLDASAIFVRSIRHKGRRTTEEIL